MDLQANPDSGKTQWEHWREAIVQALAGQRVIRYMCWWYCYIVCNILEVLNWTKTSVRERTWSNISLRKVYSFAPQSHFFFNYIFPIFTTQGCFVDVLINRIQRDNFEYNNMIKDNLDVRCIPSPNQSSRKHQL